MFETASIGLAKVWAAVGGAVGAAIGVALSDKTPKSISIMSVVCGTFIGGGLASLTCWGLGIPEDLHFYVGALYGLPGIGLAYSVIAALKDPVNTFNRIRGRKDA